MSNDKLISEYCLDMIGLHGISKSAMRSYRYKINNLVVWVEKDLADVTRDDVRDFMLELKRAGMAINTQRITATALKSFYQWAAKKYNYHNPTDDLRAIREDVKIPNLITSQDVERLIIAAGNNQQVSGARCQVPDGGEEQGGTNSLSQATSPFTKGRNADGDKHRGGMFATFICQRNAAIVCLLAETGIRRGELQELRVGDVVATDTQFLLKVHGKKTYREREIPFCYLEEGSLTSEIWCAYWQTIRFVKNWSNDDYLFQREEYSTTYDPESKRFIIGKPYRWEAGPLSTQAIHMIVKKAARRAGLNNSERISPHVIRHYYATHLAKQGVSMPVIQKRLGHSSLDRTQIYIHFADIITKDSAKINPMRGTKASFSGFVRIQKQIGNRK